MKYEYIYIYINRGQRAKSAARLLPMASPVLLFGFSGRSIHEY